MQDRIVFLLILLIAFASTTTPISALANVHRHQSSARYNNKGVMREHDNTDIAGSDENVKSFRSISVQTWNPLRLLVLRFGFTEPAWTSPLNYGQKDGTFRCAYCGTLLFDSNSKYDSGSGWPSFWRSIEDGSMSYKREFDGRLECRCGTCTSHLGHVFLDGPLPSEVSSALLEQSPPSDPRGRQGNGYLPRFCINGASLRYVARV
jgi:peptide-methionine (R)-S-oxide reductase